MRQYRRCTDRQNGGGRTNLRLYAKGGSEMAEGSQICDLRVQPSRSEGGCDL